MLLTGVVSLQCSPAARVLALAMCQAAHIIHGPICQALKAAAIRKGLYPLCEGLCRLHDGLDALESLPGGGPQLDIHLQAAAHTRGQCVRQVTLTAAASQDVWSSALQLNICHQAAAHAQGQCLRQVIVCDSSVMRRLAQWAAAVPAALWAFT